MAERGLGAGIVPGHDLLVDDSSPDQQRNSGKYQDNAEDEENESTGRGGLVRGGDQLERVGLDGWKRLGSRTSDRKSAPTVLADGRLRWIGPSAVTAIAEARRHGSHARTDRTRGRLRVTRSFGNRGDPLPAQTLYLDAESSG